MIILDERLLHAGTESLICGYTPTHSLKYFAYLYHKDKIADRNYSFPDVKYCDDDCEFCLDEKTALKGLGEMFDERHPDKAHYDLVAGDLSVFGWIIVRNGVKMNDEDEKRLGHVKYSKRFF